MSRHIGLWLVRQYQKYLSPLVPNTCRYYPTCSEYALWSLKNQNFFLATFWIVLRILRCNQLFKGGIDYPIKYAKLIPNCFKPCKISFWFIPIKDNKDKFFIIKSFV